MQTGYLLAALTILLFGSWAVFTRNDTHSPTVQALWLATGHMVLSASLFLGNVVPFPIVKGALPFIAGILWSFGIVSGYRGIKELGITRAQGIWIPVVIIISAGWGLWFFREATRMSGAQLAETIAALVVLACAAISIVWSSRHDEKLGNIPAGIASSMLLGLLHGSFFVLIEVSGLTLVQAFVPMTVGMVTTLLVAAKVKKLRITAKPAAIGRMMIAGVILGSGNYTALLTTQYLGVSLGYPLTQLGIVVNTLWGVFYFKEATTRRAQVLIAVGIVLAVLGAVLLGDSRR